MTPSSARPPRVVLFGDHARSPRSERILRRAGCAVENGCELPPSAVAPRLGGRPVWLVRAGCWPAALGAPAFPPPSETRRPLCALGAVRRCPEKEPTDEALRWGELQRACGGDLSSVPDLRERLPPLASVFLDAAAASIFAGILPDLGGFDAAFRAVFDAERFRLVRFPVLDVYDDARLRIIQVVTSPQQGGAERIALELARGLPGRDVSTRLVTLGRPTRAAFAVPAETVDLAPLRGDRAARARAVADAADAFGADLVHGHLLDADDVARLSALGLPLVLTVHNARPGWPQGTETLRPEHAVCLIACARAVEAELRAANLTIPTRTIWNGIDFAAHRRTPVLTASGSALRRRLGIAVEDYVLVALANPRPQKRLDLLPAILEATRRRLREGGWPHGVHLLLAGAASYVSEAARESEAAVRAEVERLGLRGCVHQLGSVDPVAPVLAAANVLAAPSAYEGLSLAHLEAVAAGLSVVATDVGGTAEIACNSRSFHLLSAEDTPDDYARCLAALAGRAAADQDEVARHFDRERMLQRHVHLYARVAAMRVRRPRSGLLLVTNNFSTGGAQTGARRLLAGLASQGVRVRAAVLEETAGHLTPGCQRLIASGVQVHVLPRVGTVDPAAAVAELLTVLDADPPEVVLLWNVIPEYKLLIADSLLDVPLFDVSPGEMYYDSLLGNFRRPRAGLPYTWFPDYGEHLAGVVVKYRGEADLARRALRAPVHVIPNGVPLDGPLAQPRRDPERIVFGTAARISPQKKLEDLLAALRFAQTSLPPHVLRIAGGVERGADDYAARLRRLAEGLCVEWVGEVADSRPFLIDLDMFVMISEPAGCPNASLEAMAAGLPVIATDVGGAAEQIVDGVTGRLTPRGAVESFAAALVELASETEKRAAFGRSGRRRAEELFDVTRMVADYGRVCLGFGGLSPGGAS
jgi:glycosyltransferase involved in cell wall biosynthesis